MKQQWSRMIVLCAVAAYSTAGAQAPPMSPTILFGPYGSVRTPVQAPPHIECEHTGASNMFPPLKGFLFENLSAMASAPRNTQVTSSQPSVVYPFTGVRSVQPPRICVDTLFPPGNVRQTSILYEFTDGRVLKVPLRQDADAVFLSASAIEKFAVPYYSRRLRADSAIVRRDLLAGERP